MANERVLLPGGAAGAVLTRLAGSVMMSLTHGAAGESFARSRRADRYAAPSKRSTTMKRSLGYLCAIAILLVSTLSCSRPSADADRRFSPSEVIDLGATVTEDLPQRFWGKAFMKQMGFTRQNSFEVINWTFPAEGGNISGSNAYYTLFNHGGPHVDAPNHVGAGGGVDSYPVQAFSGPVKIFDASSYQIGRSIPVEVFQGHVAAGDIVLVFTRYVPPQTDEANPESRTLTHEAAEFLATLPVRAYGTDTFGVESLSDTKVPWIHQSFLSHEIPVYEQLLNLDKLLGKEKMFFVGVPLNIKGGDGMMVRPVVFVY
jgi:kynurenine formamidase